MPDKYIPSLESITVSAKYSIPVNDFEAVQILLKETECSSKFGWHIIRSGESLECLLVSQKDDFHETIRKVRAGSPIHFSIIAIEHSENAILVEVSCRPAMWYKISTFDEKNFMPNQVQEALMDCSHFVKSVMSVFKGKLVEPVSVYPIIQRREIRDRLLNLGLKEVAGHVDDAERHIVQNNFVESLTCSRTAFEKMLDWETKKRGLEKTNNYKNDLEKLRAKGFIDADMTQLLQSYYH
jgi:hypothetical protein